MTSLRTLLLSSAALALAASAGAAAAADAASQSTADTEGTTIGTVIVTARRIEENIQRVPTTVTAVSPEDLRQMDIVNVQDLSAAAPSVSVATYFNSLNANFAIRGLSNGVVQYFSDAPCCGGVATNPFMDVSSVQVLNGPQGTLFGRSSSAGAVLITPQHPIMNEYGGLLDATVGDYDRVQFTGVLNIPIITDHLAARLAVSTDHVDGYTKLFGESATLDGVNDQQYRLGIEFKDGGFDNYVVASYLNVDESGTGQVLAAANPNFSLYNLTQAAGPAVFGAVCAQAVSLGFSPNAATCESQRIDTLDAIGQDYRNELARLAGSPQAVRSTAPSFDGTPLMNLEHHGSVVDIAQYDFGQIGFLKLNVKNIFSFDSYTADASETSDGIGGRSEEGAFANALTSDIGSNNEMGNLLNAELGPPLRTYTDEFQIHGDIDNGLLVTTLGGFYQDQIAPPDDAGTTNLYKIFSGVLNPNLGYNNAVGFVEDSVATEWAWYTQTTLDLDRVGVHGLSLTGGYRYTWDNTSLTTLTPVINYPSGVFTPGPPPSTLTSQSAGYNFTFSVAEQVTDKLMIYGTVSHAYVPGGVNQLGQAAASLPDFTPTYAPETVLEEEIGIKSDFVFGGVVGRLDLDAYNNDFSNLFETLTGLVDGTSVRYNENVAASILRGFEAQGTLIFNRVFDLNFGFSYNYAKYTKWIGSDPFNVAVPGDPVCLPSSPAGLCFLNLANNPFPYMPAEQAHVTATYHLPVDQNLGDMKVSAIVYAQSGEFYEPDAARDEQLFPGGLNGYYQGPYATLNLRYEWTNIKQSGWNGAVFVNNVTNTIYATGKIAQLETLGFAAAIYAPPTMFGFEVWKKFP